MKIPPQPVIIVLPEDREVEADYLQTLVERECCFLLLSGRDPRASTTTGMEIRLERVYIALNTTERPPETHEGRKSRTEISEERSTETFSALRVFCDHRHLVLLGEPGSGKSTFADHVALCLAGERYAPGEKWGAYLRTRDAVWEGAALLPIRVRLREFAADVDCLPAGGAARGRAEHLLAYLEKMLRAGFYGENFPSHALRCLRRGDALLILDGLDEVGDPARRVQVAQAIADLTQRHSARSRILVTCRVRQYPLDNAVRLGRGHGHLLHRRQGQRELRPAGGVERVRQVRDAALSGGRRLRGRMVTEGKLRAGGVGAEGRAEQRQGDAIVHGRPSRRGIPGDCGGPVGGQAGSAGQAGGFQG